MKIAPYYTATDSTLPCRKSTVYRAWATKEDWYEPRLEWFKPSYEVRWPPWIPELDSPDRFRNVVKVLEGRGWEEHELEKLLGLNWLRLIRETIGDQPSGL